MRPARAAASARVRLLCIGLPRDQAQLSEPSRSGADAAAAGVVDTATRAADLAPVGMFTTAVMSTLVNPGGVKWLPGRSVVVPVQRSKNLRVYATSERCGDENFISTVTLQDPFRVQLVSAASVRKAMLVTGAAVAGP
jgi:hypothetical protein